MKIDINGVSITLTKEQLKEINKQISNTPTIETITLEDALEIVGKNRNYYNDCEFEDKQDEANSKLKVLIKAVNYLDNNNKEWKANFNDSNISKYIPYAKKGSLGGWVFIGVGSCCCDSYCSVGFYFKERNSAEIIFKRFNKLYNDFLG